VSKESYTWNPVTEEWDVKMDERSPEFKEMNRLSDEMANLGDDHCIQFEKSWNEIFLLKFTCESTEVNPLTLLESGIHFARA
tara:strand:- start:458 stop:703 length:246 start_codon:yes stop_codon:yes gene_type:complete